MNRKLTFLLSAILTYTTGVTYAQWKTSEIKSTEDEVWWGGPIARGNKMPYTEKFGYYDLELRNSNNANIPLLLSNKGRYIWSDKPFSIKIENGTVTLKSRFEELAAKQEGKTLRDAFLAAQKTHFPSSGLLPDPLFFSMPQYNTWIELLYNQNQTDILNYAKAIVSNGYPTGVIMIDDNWQRYYGNFDFKAERFPDPKRMIDELHKMGFKVMVWICPFVSGDSPEYRDLNKKGFLVKEKGKKTPAMIEWWNGRSASYDLTNPKAAEHLTNALKEAQKKYGIDGYKFDAGDMSFYDSKKYDSFDKNVISVDHTLAWQKIGLSFPFNEFRAGWKMGGQPLVQRLGDKGSNWESVQNLIPEMIAAGLMGYAYTCPDMIGGGAIGSFRNKKKGDFDQKLFVRSAQIHALMPMMQFSVAPWRILDTEYVNIMRDAAKLHQKFGDYILEEAKKSAKTGEPIVRHLEYSFPNQGFFNCKDQFMLGDKFMIAPVVTKDDTREIKLPKGNWKDDLGKKYKGDQTIKIDVPLNRLPYFEKI